MKVGSIVECVIFFRGLSNGVPAPAYVKRPLKGKIYMIRGFNRNGYVWLEEIINPPNPDTGIEYCFNPRAFRELLPPMEIQDALDSCEPILIELNK